MVLGEVIAVIAKECEGHSERGSQDLFFKMVRLIYGVRVKCPPFDASVPRGVDFERVENEIKYVEPADVLIVCQQPRDPLPSPSPLLPLSFPFPLPLSLSLLLFLFSSSSPSLLPSLPPPSGPQAGRISRMARASEPYRILPGFSEPIRQSKFLPTAVGNNPTESYQIRPTRRKRSYQIRLILPATDHRQR